MKWIGIIAVIPSFGLMRLGAAADLTQQVFGETGTGEAVTRVTLSNSHAVSAAIITYGASLQSLILPGANGRGVDIALGHATLSEYLAKRQFMGATVGRIANRIAGGRFDLDGYHYQVTQNDGSNALHGGSIGFDAVTWDIISTKADRTSSQVTLRYVSHDGDQGFPGTVTAEVTYRLDESDQLSIDYRAKTDKPTVVSLSNHAYWNLAGEGAASGAMGLTLQIPAESYLPVDAKLIPTGEYREVEGTPFDFRSPHVIGERVRAADEQIRIGRGYDHNWVIDREATPQQHLMARVTDTQSGRSMELWSDQPGLQFYSGNFLDGTSRGKSGQLYREGDAIVLEPQQFPNTVNQPAFGSVRLAPNQTYHSSIRYKFQYAAKR